MRRLFNAVSLFATTTIIVGLVSAAVSAKGPTQKPMSHGAAQPSSMTSASPTGKQVIQPDQRLANPKFVPQASNRGRLETKSARHEPNHAGAKPADVYLHNARGGNVADKRVESKIADRSKLSEQARLRPPRTFDDLATPAQTASPDQRLANPKFVPQVSNGGIGHGPINRTVPVARTSTAVMNWSGGNSASTKSTGVGTAQPAVEVATQPIWIGHGAGIPVPAGSPGPQPTSGAASVGQVETLGGYGFGGNTIGGTGTGGSGSGSGGTGTGGSGSGLRPAVVKTGASTVGSKSGTVHGTLKVKPSGGGSTAGSPN